MSEVKLYLSVRGGVLSVHGATEQIKIFVADWDEWDDYHTHSDQGPERSFLSSVVNDWCHPTEIIEGNFEEYVQSRVLDEVEYLRPSAENV